MKKGAEYVGLLTGAAGRWGRSLGWGGGSVAPGGYGGHNRSVDTDAIEAWCARGESPTGEGCVHAEPVRKRYNSTDEASLASRGFFGLFHYYGMQYCSYS